MKLKITVHGVAYEVDVEVLDHGEDFHPDYGSVPTYVAPLPGDAPVTHTPPPAPKKPVPNVSADASMLASPVAGTVLEIKCKKGDSVQAGQALMVIEAMKMQTNIAANGNGVVKHVLVAVDDPVREGQALVEFE
jgi:biotin carboxyl carrier protein